MMRVGILLTSVLIGWVQSSHHFLSGTNLARSGEAQQSSVYSPAPQFSAATAIDGIEETDIYKSPCVHTNHDHEPWWRLDLNTRHKIRTVAIVNRGDCCRDRLKGAHIRVGNSPDNNNPVCATVTDVSRALITVSCHGMEGRYVSVVIPGRAEYLQLCEVKVYGEESPNQEGTNLARSGEAQQSSVYSPAPQFSAATAIDGIEEANIYKSPCAHTNHDHEPWWRLDLNTRHKIRTVAIVNRGDCCRDRLKGAHIRVGNSPDNNNPVCATVTDVSRALITVSCHGMEGRYVSVVIPGRAEYLQLCEVKVYGEESPNQEGTNLAISGEAQQSSVYSPAPQFSAATAIDGIEETNIYKSPCVLTNRNHEPWWRLDLKKRYKIRTVVIVNRGDCCSERLKGAQIRVGNSPDNNNPVCAIITDTAKVSITVSCYGIEGRYISVVIPERAEYLQLCEVKVYGEESPNHKGTNLATSGKAQQSSVFSPAPQYSAATAIDGIEEANIYKSPCAHTNLNHEPWWRLDLNTRHRIRTVVIVNRGDCCRDRLKGAQIRVGNSPDNKNPVCATITDVSRALITVFCHGMVGRYVSVVIPGRAEYLTLCEVEVYGMETPNLEVSGRNLARSGKARQSSDYRHPSVLMAERAIDGITETDLNKSPCTHTNRDYQPWWQLDLDKRYQVKSVIVVNRRDCCSQRLLGAQIRVGDSADNNNPVCGTITDVSQASITVSCHGLEGRYVSVVIPGREEYLTLCEVEVYGEECP
eukprot:XP_017950678.1 PREDICTED: uncharacterized protein LOC100498436 isoform X1 [Xenopus tropicalis]